LDAFRWPLYICCPVWYLKLTNKFTYLRLYIMGRKV
jgi:hypothetical protein